MIPNFCELENYDRILGQSKMQGNSLVDDEEVISRSHSLEYQRHEKAGRRIYQQL